MYISGRERKLIELLLSYQEPITIRKLAGELNVSERTVHRDLKNTEEILQQYGLEVSKKSGGVGISIVGQEDNKSRLKLATFHLEHTDYTPEERQAMILTTLLETKEPIKLYTLATELQVTVATVSNDLDMLDGILEKYGLKLIRKRGYGVKVEGGEEGNKRSVISYLISKHVDESDVITLLRKNIEKQSQEQTDTISNRLLGLVDRTKLSIIEQTINRVRNKLPYELADSSYVGLVVHLALAMERLQKGGENIQFDKNYLNELSISEEYRIAKDIILELEQVFQISIPNDEIGYITMHLLGAKLRYDHEYLLEESSLDIAFKAKELIEYVGKRIDRQLFEQDHILNDLVAHLKPAIYRLKQGMNIKNPLAQEIEDDYQEIFSVIEEAVKNIFPELIFPKEETAYLVLHFASALLKMEEKLSLRALVICSSGIGTSKMLATKINQQIAEIATVDNYSLFELDKLNLDNYDLIVSTIPIKHIERDYILASPILSKSEIHQIKSRIRKIKMKKSILTSGHSNKLNTKREYPLNTLLRLQMMQQYTNEILPILEDFYVDRFNKQTALQHVLQDICNNLKHKNILKNSEKVVNNLIKRSEIGGLGLPGTSLALLHTRSEEVCKLSFTIHPLAEEILIEGMDGNPVYMKNLLLMLSPPADYNETGLEVLSYISGLLIKSEESKAVFQSANEKRIREYLAYQFNEFITEKIDLKN
ncbi:mannitol operon activator [Gracilibacillus boraciitolerans JCM 21714]|uniref:Mannitol operon activator n=1 Tax=Gracilibacillus boraciitolerans JCM 21714 TaxID=1298598 RepID=W4VGW8_9BACI|nr:BglG family transcription antiterminator [Gracilibacillus boraciitolerans]GAE92068.1 mannitol operon activator [Gracilibacillus boraciitolerans JCM 21714]